jgi:hypothetical protein
VSAAVSASAPAAWAAVAEARPDALARGRLRPVPTETSAEATRGTRTLARMPSLSRPAPTVPLVPELEQLPTSLDRTRPSAQTRTSAEVGRPSRASAETSWALVAPAPRASRPPAERGRAECALHPQVHLELSLGSEFEDVEHVARGR